MMMRSSCLRIISGVIWAILICSLPTPTRSAQCGPDGFVYGENELVDRLLTCSRSKLADLDLTPQGEYIKSTSRTLVDQGLSNKTTILYARLNGLWTAKRASVVDTAWKCNKNKTIVHTIIELTNLSLEVLEKLDVPVLRNQQKMATHKPCKTFNLPLWMCRQSKSFYRTTKTWINRAYFNMTLTQDADAGQPKVGKLWLMFTCPETSKQKITHSPSAMYILPKYFSNQNSTNFSSSSEIKHETRRMIKRNVKQEPSTSGPGNIATSHPVLYANTQDGKGPATPPYHNSVNLMLNQISEALHSSINDCIESIDSDLSLMVDHNSFNQYNFRAILSKESEGQKTEDWVGIECSNKFWLKRRIELANELADTESEPSAHASHSKRSQFLLKYPVDPNQLLNPYGYYHNNADLAIEDS